MNKSTKSDQAVLCRNCHQPFLLNHQCVEDNDDQFGDSDDDDDELKNPRMGNLAKWQLAKLRSASAFR